MARTMMKSGVTTREETPGVNFGNTSPNFSSATAIHPESKEAYIVGVSSRITYPLSIGVYWQDMGRSCASGLLFPMQYPMAYLHPELIEASTF